jgi:hypothetical protein
LFLMLKEKSHSAVALRQLLEERERQQEALKQWPEEAYQAPGQARSGQQALRQEAACQPYRGWRVRVTS